MYRNSMFKRIVSLLLTLVLVASCLPAGLLTTADAAEQSAGVISGSKLSDPATLNAWKDTAFNPYDLTTEHAGGVWTDKSVLENNAQIGAALPGVSGLNLEGNNFLVALSALGANSIVAGQASTPADVIFVLDVSYSMANNDLTEMVQATNDAIHNLLQANQKNRVGVVVYSGDVEVLLELNRYNPVQKGATTNSTADDETAYIELVSSGSRVQIRTARLKDRNWAAGEILTNSAGSQVNITLSTKGMATYIQGGMWKAMEMFQNADVNASEMRTPFLVLMSDGAPTSGSNRFNDVDPDSATVTSSNGTPDAGFAFLTQLSAIHVKKQIEEKYKVKPYFLTVGLGVGGSGNEASLAEAVLDTSRQLSSIENIWTRYSALASQSNKTMSVTVGNRSTNVTYDSNITAESKSYVDRYFAADDASQLSTAFQSIVNEIQLKAGYTVTRVEGADANSGGYVTFVDEIGSGMEVKAVKGILIGTTLYTGENLVKALLNNEFGTAGNSTTLGNNMMWALQQRLGVTDKVVQTANGTVTVTVKEQIHDLIQKAYAAGQIAYDAATGEYRNEICWFSDANGNYLAFWDSSDPNCVIPNGAAYANTSYGMLGATTSSQTAHASDMMYVSVMVSKKITQVAGQPALEDRTPEIVTFRVPAALLPTVTYQIEVEAASGEEITEGTPAKITYNPAEPIRLLYEVGVHSKLTPENVQDFLRDGYAAKDRDGNYYLYTNAWYWEPDSGVADPNNPPQKGDAVLYDTDKNHLTYAYFEPSEQNEHYYFAEDTDLYTFNGTSYVKLTTAPVTDGSVQYFFQHKTYESKSTAAQTGVEVEARVDIHYGKVEDKAAKEALRGSDGVYYIPEGTMHYGTIHAHDIDKWANNTQTFKYRMHQLVDIVVDGNDVATHNYEIAYLGNNGRITYSPAQGFTLSKVMAAGASATGEFTFDVTLSEDADGKYTETINGVSTVKDMTGNGFTVSLEAGKQVTITGIDKGATYTVTERQRDGYKLGSIVVSSGSTSGATATGTVAENTLHSITYTNDIQQYGSLLVSKSVTYNKGSQPQTDPHTFQITVTLSGMAGKQVYVDGVLTTLDAQGKTVLTLAAGTQAMISGIPEGTAYTVEETAALTAGYAVAEGNFSGTIARNEVAVAGVKNTYTPGSVSVDDDISISIQKLLEVSFSDGGNSYMLEHFGFNFLLEQYNEQTRQWLPVGSGTTITIANPAEAGSSFYGEGNKANGSIDMSGVSFDAVGSYYFRVREEIPTNLNAGWTYDRTHHDFEVVVTDTDLDGQLEISQVKSLQHSVVTSNSGKWNVATEFENDYTVKSTKLTIGARKTLSGAVLKDGQFAFALYKTDDSYNISGITPATAKNGANGDVIFPTIIYPFDSGDNYHYYVMKETSTDGNGVKVDDSVYQIRVTVTGGASAQAVVSRVEWRKQGETAYSSVTELNGNVFESITFDNTYTAASVDAEITAGKTLTDLTPGAAQTVMTVPANTYKFKLQAVTANAPMPAETEVFAAAGGAVSFGEITFTKAGTYVYELSEVDVQKPGVTTDTGVYTVTVTVTDNGVGQLVAATAYSKGSVLADRAVFNNTYKAAPTGDLKITAKKELTVGSGFDRLLGEGEFRVMLTHPNGTTETVSNDANGVFNFATVSFDTVGRYTYALSEIVPQGAVAGKYNGVGYDTATKVFTIEVKDNGAGQLEAWLGSQKLSSTATGVATVENTYTADPATVQLTAYKDLTGRELAEKEFSFKLEAITAGAPMPANAVVENAADGVVDFGNIRYTAVGTYQYKVTELDKNGDALTDGYTSEGVTYSQKEYTVTVVVSDLGNGKLKAEVSSVDEENQVNAYGIVFVNTYTAEPVDAQITATKKLTNTTVGAAQTVMTVPANTYKFKLEAVTANAPMPAETEVFAAAGGAVSFGQITYTEAGAYMYELSEIDVQLPGITTDSGVYEVTVTITDNGLGQLVVTSITFQKAGNACDEAIFENMYLAKATSVTFEGEKKLNGDMQLVADAFRFVLKDAAGQQIEIVKNDAEGKFAFTAIPFGAEGVFTYTMEEINDGAEGIEYDTTKYSISVTVTDVNGELKAVTVISAGEETAESCVFTNTYVQPEPDPTEPEPTEPAPTDSVGGEGDVPPNGDPGNTGANNGNENIEIPEDTPPKTGDESHVGRWMLMMAVSAVGVLAVLVLGKKMVFEQ